MQFAAGLYDMKFGIDLIKHFLCMLVIVQHMTSSRYSSETNGELRDFVDWIDGAVAGFFFISGYLYKSHDKFIEYSKKQTIRLLVPFFVFSLFYTACLAMLGKISVYEGIIGTITLSGCGMQLYFLPYLLFLTIVYSFWSRTIPAMLLPRLNLVVMVALIVVCMIFPTETSTGNNFRLIPFYLTAFLLGTFFKFLSRTFHPSAVVAAIFMAIGLIDKRFVDIAMVTLVFGAVISVSDHLPDRRIPGSGGVYLMHTPIINFAISTILMNVGVTEEANIVLSVPITFVVCIGITLCLVRYAPEQKWVILE